METLKLLISLYFRPLSAFSELLDHGNWLIAAVLCFAAAAGFYFSVNQRLEKSYRPITPQDAFMRAYEELEYSDDDALLRTRAEAVYREGLARVEPVPVFGSTFFRLFSVAPRDFFQPLISISVLFIPLLIFWVGVYGRVGSFGLLVRRDYGALATCTLTAWAAAHLPATIVALIVPSGSGAPSLWFGLWLASGIYFGILMIGALRVIFGTSFVIAAMAVVCSAPAFTVGIYVFQFISPWLFSPILLLLGFMYFGGALSGGNDIFRQRQNFKRFLENATINPRDADAHVQLGLIYLQRRQDEKAREHFATAVEIDPDEVDARFELGRLARKAGELQLALDHFAIVLDQNDKFRLSEIWREIGITYYDAGMNDAARDALEKFVERRPVDPEGLYYLGKLSQRLGLDAQARDYFSQAVDSARTSPDFRRGELKHWEKLALRELK
jgi:tetratricopeptide (TPR) repeat protein